MSVLLALIMGYFDSTPALNLSFGYLQLFVLGYVITEERLEKLLRDRRLLVSVVALILFAVACIVYGKYWIFSGGSIFYFFWKPYPTFGPYLQYGILFRGLAYILSVFLGFCYLVFVYKAQWLYYNVVLTIGQFSIYPYLFHYCIVMLIWKYVGYSRGLTHIIAIVGSGIIAWALSTKQVRRLENVIVRL